MTDVDRCRQETSGRVNGKPILYLLGKRIAISIHHVPHKKHTPKFVHIYKHSSETPSPPVLRRKSSTTLSLTDRAHPGKYVNNKQT